MEGQSRKNSRLLSTAPDGRAPAVMRECVHVFCYARHMANLTGLQKCSICAAPGDVLEAINRALRERKPLRALAVESGFTRSSLSRHSIRCMPREALARNKTLRGKSGRKIIEYVSEKAGEASTFTLINGTPISRAEILPTDTIYGVEVIYTQPEITNPSALKPERLRRFLDETRAADRPAVEAMMKDAGLTVAEPDRNAEIATAPQECESDASQQASHPPEPVEPWNPSECKHHMVPVNGGVERCCNCGFQRGGSHRARSDNRTNLEPRRPLYGRFG